MNPSKILIINIFGIGDVLFTTPLIKNLKQNFPEAQIDYLCNRRTEQMVRKNENISQVFVYERDEFIQVKRQSKIAYLKKVMGFQKQLKTERYDVVFDFSLNRFIGFMCLWIGIPQRIGFNFKNRGFFLNHKIPLGLNGYHEKHVVEYYLDLLRAVGIEATAQTMELPIDQEDRKWANEYWQSEGINAEQKIIGLIPGGGSSWGKDAHLKRWSPQNYAKLADKLIENYGTAIILLGDKAEEDLVYTVVQFMNHNAHTACGKTTISQFAALAQKCSLIVANDGGPLHMAVAAGAKTVSIFGPVDDRVYGPYPREGHQVVKVDGPPAYRGFRLHQAQGENRLNQLTVEDVYRKVEQLL